jgi:hypothetical protein
VFRLRQASPSASLLERRLCARAAVRIVVAAIAWLSVWAALDRAASQSANACGSAIAAAAVFTVIGVPAAWMGLSHLCAAWLVLGGASKPSVVQHFTSRAARAAIERDGVLRPGGSLTLLDVVCTCGRAKVRDAEHDQPVEQALSVNWTPPFMSCGCRRTSSRSRSR